MARFLFDVSLRRRRPRRGLRPSPSRKGAFRRVHHPDVAEMLQEFSYIPKLPTEIQGQNSAQQTSLALG